MTLKFFLYSRGYNFSHYKPLMLCLLLYSIDVDSRLKNELEQRKTELENALSQIDQEVRTLNADLRNLEDEAAKLHKQRVRSRVFPICFQCVSLSHFILKILCL